MVCVVQELGTMFFLNESSVLNKKKRMDQVNKSNLNIYPYEFYFPIENFCITYILQKLG